MLFRFFLLIFLSLQIISGFSASHLSLTDTTKVQKLPRTKEAFLSRHGSNNSSRALIQYFFEKRKQSKKNIIINTVASVVGGISFAVLVMSSSAAGIGAALGLALGVVFWVCLLAAFIYGIIFFNFSRKKLLRLLQAYQLGKPIPKKIQNSRRYKQLLKREIQEAKK